MNLFRSRSWTDRRELGVILLAAWLIVIGIMPLFKLDSGTMTTVVNILAVAAGLALLFRR